MMHTNTSKRRDRGHWPGKRVDMRVHDLVLLIHGRVPAVTPRQLYDAILEANRRLGQELSGAAALGVRYNAVRLAEALMVAPQPIPIYYQRRGLFRCTVRLLYDASYFCVDELVELIDDAGEVGLGGVKFEVLRDRPVTTTTRRRAPRARRPRPIAGHGQPTGIRPRVFDEDGTEIDLGDDR
jgi:hypothetical protein